MERTTMRRSPTPGTPGARDWPMTIVLGLALLFSGMPAEITALEWAD
jgi:hypothetical protein